VISAASLRVTVGSDIKDAIAGLGRVNNAISDTASAFRTGAGAAVGFAAGVLGLQGLGSIADGLNAAIFGMNNTLQGAGIAFRTMLGSGEAAGSMLEQIKQFAKTTPFDLPQVLAGARNILAYGFSVGEVLPLLRDLGNVSAGLDLGAEGISRMTRALGQMRAKGRVLQEDLNQLQEVGVNTNQVFAIMAKNTGKTVPQLKKLQEAGKLDSAGFLTAFQQFSRERFGNLMEEQSKTLVGAMSNIRDSLGQTGADVFLPFFQLVQDGALHLANFLATEEFAAWAAAIKQHVAGATGEFRTLLQTIQNIQAAHGVSTLDAAIVALETRIRELFGEGASNPFHAFIESTKTLFTNLFKYSLQEQIDLFLADLKAIPGRIKNDVLGIAGTLGRDALAAHPVANAAFQGASWLANNANGGTPSTFDPAASRGLLDSAKSVTIGTINVRSQADLDYIAALVGAQEEVSAAASPDAPGQ
jgi:tape measure domain-containing protein